MLEIDNLGVRYGRAITALRSTSLRVNEGEIVGIVGHNGAGKSTILKAVAGIVRPFEGAISFEGQPLKTDPAENIRRGIAFVPEDRRIFASLTVGENLRLGATIRKDRDVVDQDIERELARFTILGKLWKKGASTLSGGEQQQLAIARALISRPRLLLLDEPTLGLSPIMVDLMYDVAAQLRGEGVTILLVEQNARRVLELSDRVYVLASPGKVLGHGSKQELAQVPEVGEYLGFDFEPDGVP